MPRPVVMTERSLYARLGVLILWLLLLGTKGLAQQSPQPPCPRCIAVLITPGQVLLLPEDLHGLTFVVRDAGEGVRTIRAAIDAVRARGGTPVALLTDPSGPSGGNRSYAAKLRLTELRSSLGTDVRLAASVATGRDLPGYADVLIGPGERAPNGPPVWPLLADGDLPRALAVGLVDELEDCLQRARAEPLGAANRRAWRLVRPGNVPADCKVLR